MSRKQWGHGYHTAMELASKSTPPDPTGLKGKWFHTFYDDNGKKRILEQGQVLSLPTPDTLLVQYYSWIDGNPTNQKILKLTDMMDAHFYANDKEMRWAYAKSENWSGESWEAHERMIKRVDCAA